MTRAANRLTRPPRASILKHPDPGLESPERGEFPQFFPLIAAPVPL